MCTIYNKIYLSFIVTGGYQNEFRLKMLINNS
ncbi:hypothetical protein FHS70_005492 [Flammeovirga yaeyamensis]|nr:hypothetical protein [Flammeovirga yaeyamensis]